MEDHGGASPDRLLAAVNRAAEAAGARTRGKLRVFFGLGPGVGKTYAMLEAAHQLRARGVRVAIGVVETHGRSETEALLENLDVIPRRLVSHRGLTVGEMDVDAILTARPAVVLIDELAHTNAPGSRHQKRYLDVEEVLSAGIDVLTTINVQHLESRSDEVARITGVRVRELVPDRVLELADQIEVVDLPAQELRRRLSEGKVYAGEAAARAAENFFREENVLALRELALRFVAERVDQDLHQRLTLNGIAGPWNTGERLLVAMSHGPNSKRLIRRTRRMAFNLSAPWIALHVDRGDRATAAERESLREHCALARELGAEVLSVADRDVARAIGQVSRDRHVTQIVMGRPDRRPVRDLLNRGNMLDRLVGDVSGVDLHVIRGPRRAAGRWMRPVIQSGVLPYYHVAWFMISVTIACRAVLDLIGYRALGSIFLLAILAVSAVATAGPVLFAALLAAFAWDFFFIPPTWTFVITSFADLMMVTSFFVAAVVGGLLTTRLKRQEQSLAARETEARHLYELVRRLALAESRDAAVAILVETVGQRRGFEASVLFPGEDQALGGAATVDAKIYAVAAWTFANAKPAGWSTATLSAAPALCWPMVGNSGVLGVLTLVPAAGRAAPDVRDEAFLATVVTQTSVILESIALRERAEANRLVETSAKLHQTLLNSVSHELRTPITALIGTAETLRRDQLEPRVRDAFVDDIARAARRLDRTVANLLDVSRLEQGSLRLRREWFEAGDVFDDVKRALQDELGGKTLAFAGDRDALIEGDFQLIALVAQQLVLNAIRYAWPARPIDVLSRVDGGAWTLTVRDEGPGLAGEATRVFEKFYRGDGAPAGGLGLGLAIAKSIVDLHGGQLTGRNRADGRGAEFTISLNLSPAPAVLREVQGG